MAQDGAGGHKLAKLFIFGGIGAVLMGLLTGSIFGDLFHFRGLIDPIKNALTLLGIALGLGVIQLFLGTALAALPSLREGKWRDAFFNQGWSGCSFLASVMLLSGEGRARAGPLQPCHQLPDPGVGSWCYL